MQLYGGLCQPRDAAYWALVPPPNSDDFDPHVSHVTLLSRKRCMSPALMELWSDITASSMMLPALNLASALAVDMEVARNSVDRIVAKIYFILLDDYLLSG